MLHTTPRSKALAALSVAALIVVAAACSDDDDDAADVATGGTRQRGERAQRDDGRRGDDISRSSAATERGHLDAERTHRGHHAGDDLVGRAAARGPAEPGPGRHARLRPRGRQRQPVGAVSHVLRHELPRRAPRHQRLAVRRRPGRRDGAVPRGERRAQRRLHAVDAARPRRHHVPRRHPARRRRGEVQHRHLPRQPAHRDGVPPDRHRRGVGPGRHDLPPRRRVDRAPRVLRVRLSAASCSRRSGWAACRTCRSATRSRPSTTRRWRRRPPTATRSSPSGSGRSSTSRTRRATATPSWPSATPTTGGARTGSPASSCRTSTGSSTSWPSTRTAAPTRSGRATSTS